MPRAPSVRPPAESSRDPLVRGDLPAGGDPLLERISWILDNSIKVPGTRYRVGVDPLLGLFPGVGDFLSAVIQAGIVMLAIKRYHVPKSVATRMATNVLLDMGVGSVPILGDLFDAAFKASSRNMKLLRDVHEQRQKGAREEEISRASRRHVMLIGGLMGAGLTLTLIAAIVMVVWLVKLIFSTSA